MQLEETTQLQSNTSQNTDQQHKPELHSEIQPIKGTPFVHVEQEGKHFIAMGTNRISDTFTEEEELYQDLEDNQIS